MLVMKMTCDYCNKRTKKLQDCGGKCGGAASYCDENCQRKDWKEHKKICHKGRYNRKNEKDKEMEKKLCDEIKRRPKDHTKIRVYDLNKWHYREGIYMEMFD